MALNNYGVLKGHAIAGRADPASDSTPHYQILLNNQGELHRVSVNVKSKVYPSELLYFVDDQFHHPLLEELVGLDLGFHSLPRESGGLALDFIRGNLFPVAEMRPLPPDVPGPDNDLKELIDLHVQRAVEADDAVVYAFGEPWGPEPNTPDKYFGFLPGRGIHDVHMNQGSVEPFRGSNGVWQDGALLIQFPSRNQWIAIFLAFQSQCFHTDDTTGHPLAGVCDRVEPEANIKIIAALVNPSGHDPGKESVTLINVSPETVNLSGWALTDKNKRKHLLQAISIAPGDTALIPLTGADVQLSNKGGIITLLNPQGVKIHGVAYTKKDVKKQGWTLAFCK